MGSEHGRIWRKQEVKRNELYCIRGPCESCEVDGLDIMLLREGENGVRDSRGDIIV